MKIRIIDVPPGEAPASIRKCWVGLNLPLAEGEEGPRLVRTWGVLSAPRTLMEALWRRLLGRYNWEQGYIVDAPKAIRILERHAPEAADWWYDNTAFWKHGARFVFTADVCEEV